MPITDTNVIDGPNVQPNGEHRGTLEFIFDDGRVFTRNVRAEDAQAWANLAVDLPAQIESLVQADDAEEAVEADEEVAPYKQASREQLALAYLRRAHQNEDPYRAYLQFSRFNDWRLAQGYNLNQVADALADVGLTQDEWDLMLAAYQYLSNAARVTAMEAYQSIKNGWPDYQG